MKNRNAPEVDILAVRDATLNTTAPIRRCSQPRLTINSDPLLEHVVVLATWDLGPSETGTNLEAFGGRDGQHGVSEERLELVKAWLAETGGNVAEDTGDGAT
jgi:hypothetical protein